MVNVPLFAITHAFFAVALTQHCWGTEGHCFALFPTHYESRSQMRVQNAIFTNSGAKTQLDR